MSHPGGEDLSGYSMGELFRIEVEAQSAILSEALLALEHAPREARGLESVMRAAHSIKGAARIINVAAAVRVAHAMEDCFVAAQKGTLLLDSARIDILLRGVDLLRVISRVEEPALEAWTRDHTGEVQSLVEKLAALGERPPEATPPPSPALEASDAPAGAGVPASASGGAVEAPETQPSGGSPSAGGLEGTTQDRVVRMSADSLNRLLALAGESLVESRSLAPLAESFLRLKRLHMGLGKSLGDLREALSGRVDERAESLLSEAQRMVTDCRVFLAGRQEEIDTTVWRSANLSNRLYREALASRMRPFGDAIKGYSRMVRDVSRSLGKDSRLEIVGESTRVDRDLLEKIEAPLNHLIRNAIDHGIEASEERVRAGKPHHGTVRLDARHSAGMLNVTVADDGRGIDLEKLRKALVERRLTTEDVAAQLSEEEVFEFLFLPGFTLRETVSEISGRGVGLDIVQSMVQEVRGSVRVTSEWGRGTRFQLQLPLTLSVVRALLVDVGGEPYAFPLARVARVLKLPREQMEVCEGRQHFVHNGQSIGLVSAHQLLEVAPGALPDDHLPIVILGDRTYRYGLVVDRFLGERELVVHPLDARLGKIQDVSAGSLMADGSPVLIMDVDDLLCSIGNLITGHRLKNVESKERGATKTRKRILVVDDSITVRELERKLLSSRGYDVEVAVDGMDGWNAVRTGAYDLIISDVDMPRLDGVELVSRIKKDPKLHGLPAMIVSYNDREEDRRRGLEAGANYYLTKGSFHDEVFLNAVVDLIGAASP